MPSLSSCPLQKSPKSRVSSNLKHNPTHPLIHFRSLMYFSIFCCSSFFFFLLKVCFVKDNFWHENRVYFVFFFVYMYFEHFIFRSFIFIGSVFRFAYNILFLLNSMKALQCKLCFELRWDIKLVVYLWFLKIFHSRQMRHWAIPLWTSLRK